MKFTTRNIVLVAVVLAVLLGIAAFYGWRTMQQRVDDRDIAVAPPVEQPATPPEEAPAVKDVEVIIPPPDAPRRYTCANTEVIFISDKTDNAMMFIGERAYRLTRTPAASGVKYVTDKGQGAPASFWVKGDEALLEGEGATSISCKIASRPTDVEPRAGDAVAVEPAQGNIEGTVWQAFEFNGKPLAESVIITLELNDGRIAGRSACNRYTGPYEIDMQSRSLEITGPLAGTRMACMPDVMDVENAFNAGIGKITAYRVDDGPVLVLFAGGDEMLRLKPQAAQ